jgi:hypothetical protein
VVHDGRLCGHVVGGKRRLPWAYMVPIRQTMREIKLAFGTDNICLPKNVNEYPTRTMQANIDTYNSEKSPIISPPQAPSVQRIDDQNEKVMDSGASSTQIHLQAPNCPAPRSPVNSYRMILSKLKEESRRFSTVPPPNAPIIAQGSGSVDEIHAISARAGTPPGWQDPESWVPGVHEEPKSSGLQHIVSSTGSRRSQHALPANAVDNTNPVSALPDVSSAPDPESWVPSAQNEPKSSTLQSNMPLTRSLWRAWRKVALIEWLVVMLAFGLIVGLPVGLVSSSVGRGLSKDSKVGIVTSAGAVFLVLTFLYWWAKRARMRRGRAGMATRQRVLCRAWPESTLVINRYAWQQRHR